VLNLDNVRVAEDCDPYK